MQTAPADFGAAIEALQRNYVKTHPESFKTKLVPESTMWQNLSGELRHAISTLNIPEEDKRILFDKVGGLNDTPRSETMKVLLESMNIELGADEKQAWGARQTKAAMGGRSGQPTTAR